MKKPFWIILIIIIVIFIAAALGGLVFGWFNPKASEQSQKIPTASQPARNIVALGDSLTQAAALSSQLPGDNPDYSFATGTQISSFYLSLKNAGKNLTAKNLAVSGATSAALLTNQVPQVAAYKPKYITLLVGGNDLLQQLSASQFETNLRQIVCNAKIKDAQILIATLPNFIAMRSDSIPACTNTNLSPALKALAVLQIQNYNSKITKIAQDYNLTLVNLFPILTSEHISTLDCMHFNIAGQQKVAEEFIKKITP